MANTTMQTAAPASAWLVRVRSSLIVARRVPKIPTTVLLVLMIFAIFGQWIAPHSPVAVDMANSFAPPVWHEEGTAIHIGGAVAVTADQQGLQEGWVDAEVEWIPIFSLMLSYCSIHYI